MQYICYECNKKGVRTEVSNDIDERFISLDGRCLCDECSKGVEKATGRQMDIMKKYYKEA